MHLHTLIHHAGESDTPLTLTKLLILIFAGNSQHALCRISLHWPIV